MGEPNASRACFFDQLGMKVTFVLVLAMLATVYAGSKKDSTNDGIVCRKVAGATANELWKAGKGSSACTGAGNDIHWYKGHCSNSDAKYTITTYQNSACTTVNSTTTMSVGSGASATFGGETFSLISCNACP